MASSPPEYHLDRLGYRLGNRPRDFILAAEKWLANTNPMIEPPLASKTLAASRCTATAIFGLHVQPKASIAP